MQYKGFSLIELLLVMLMISILMSIAIPNYQEYVIRTRVIELLAVAQPAKLVVAEALLSGMSQEAIDNNSLTFPKTENNGKVKNMSIAKGIITIVGDAIALGTKEDLILTLTPNQKGHMLDFACTVQPSTYKKYAPKHCLSHASIPVTIITVPQDPPQVESADEDAEEETN